MSDVGGAHRVLLVGPWRAGQAGGGCCGADPAGIGGREVLGDAAESCEAHDAAAVVRALRSGVMADVQLVDPRNTAFLVPVVYRDARAHGLGRRAALREAVRATTPWALVADGQVVGRGMPLTPGTALRQLPVDIPRVSATR